MRHAATAADATQKIIPRVEYPLIGLSQRTVGIAAERAVNAGAFVVPTLERLGFLRKHHTELRACEAARLAFVPRAIEPELIDVVFHCPASAQHYVRATVGRTEIVRDASGSDRRILRDAVDLLLAAVDAWIGALEAACVRQDLAGHQLHAHSIGVPDE